MFTHTTKDLLELTLSFSEDGEELESEFKKRDLKQMLLNEFPDTITIVENPRQNESDIVFSSAISQSELAVKLKNLNVYHECGTELRNVLFSVDYGLNDSFCDSESLEDAWKNIVMPCELASFLSPLFKLPMYKLFRSPELVMNDLLNMDDHDCDNEAGKDGETGLGNHIDTDNKSIQMHCLFQILVYILNNGRITVPLRTMMGRACFSNNRNKTHITNLNHIGVSESYSKVKSRRNLLMGYYIQSAKENVPLPSTFTRDKEDFTQGATDNSNYLDRPSLSGTEMKNYAALCLYQDKTRNPSLAKPSVSSTGLNPKAPLIRSELVCQKVQKYFKPKERPSLPENMIIVSESKKPNILDLSSARRSATEKEFLISCLRVGISPVSMNTPIWQATHTLISDKNVPLMRVGNLPVIPRPITESATVNQVCLNFENVRKQLNQPTMPIWCDEGVFDILIDVVLYNPAQFSHIFAAMGPFHWSKIIQKCCGKFLRGSGLEDALVECGTFGPGTIETVLNGKHYYRSLAGFLIIDDLISSLQWQAFWVTHQKDKYPFLIQLQNLTENLERNQVDIQDFAAATEYMQPLFGDFQKFLKE